MDNGSKQPIVHVGYRSSGRGYESALEAYLDQMRNMDYQQIYEEHITYRGIPLIVPEYDSLHEEDIVVSFRGADHQSCERVMYLHVPEQVDDMIRAINGTAEKRGLCITAWYDSDMAYFVDVLMLTGREGMWNVIGKLIELGFFSAPASTAFHLNEKGGLLKHSINVYREAMAIRQKQIELCPEIAKRLPADSVAIAALLHDVCKAEIYREATRSWKLADGSWEKRTGYDVDYSSFPVGHGEKSVIRLLQWGLSMTDDEILAIRWHMEAWDLAFQSPEQKSNLGAAKERCALLNVIKAADGLASFILESR